MSSDIIQLGMLVGIINGAFELAKYAINRATDNGTGGIRNHLNKLEENHLHTLKEILLRIDLRTEQLLNKMDVLIERLRK